MHAIGNNLHRIPVAEGSYLQKFFAVTGGMSASEIAKHLEEDDDIEAAHGASADEGCVGAGG